VNDYAIYRSAAKACGFYDTPLWIEGQQKPDYFDLFEWSEHPTFGDQKSGHLRDELFDTIDKKIAYIQGVFEDYSGLGMRESNCICFANSSKKVERCKEWIGDIARDRMTSLPPFCMAIIEHNIRYMVPICHTVTIDPAVIKYIQDYKFV
jgi:hypothetical protein